jgi:hypothetical protein
MTAHGRSSINQQAAGKPAAFFMEHSMTGGNPDTNETPDIINLPDNAGGVENRPAPNKKNDDKKPVQESPKSNPER